MEISGQTYLTNKAINVIKSASASFYIRASSLKENNYGHIWSRDSAVAGLAIISNKITDLYAPLKNSLLLLQKSASISGQIPSNLKLNHSGTVVEVSFGGPVGRVDSSFWWVISTALYLKQTDDQDFKDLLAKQCTAIFTLADCWEFNGKGLIYVPMSSNWADEYITNGYVLYDQLLRYWALMLAADLFKNENWLQKASEIKTSVKQHYLLEGDLDNSLYTATQKKLLVNFDLGKKFIASFSPGESVEKYDGWSIALLFLLDIPSAASAQKLSNALSDVLAQTNNNGIPAFWPVINESDSYYQSLSLNHNYNFKNKPGHFHNGGIWPVVNGFLIAGLECAGYKKLSKQLTDILENKLSQNLAENPFAEYFDFYKGLPGGVNNLCFSAAGYLLATLAVNNNTQFTERMFPYLEDKENLIAQLEPYAEQLIENLVFDKSGVTAVSIAGESGSGKSTLTNLLKDILTRKGFNVLLLFQDDYFKLPPNKNNQARLKDFSVVGVDEVRLELLDKDILTVKEGKESELSVPFMNWVTDTEEYKIHNVANIDVVLVDGTYTTLLTAVDYRVFINTNFKQTRKNRINRNREAVTPFIEGVLKRESEIIGQHKNLVDLEVDSQFAIVKNNLTTLK